MRKVPQSNLLKSNLLLNLIIISTVLLAACSQATPAPKGLTPSASTAGQPPAATQAPLATLNPNAATMQCQVISLKPTQGPTEVSMFPPPGKEDWVLGKNPSAPLTITEYSDFQ